MENFEYIHNYPFYFSDDFPMEVILHPQYTYTPLYLHVHNGFEIGVCLEGDGVFFVENKVYSFTRGSISIISSDQPHIAQSPSEKPSRWIFINFDWERLFGTEEITVRQHIFEDPQIASLLQIIYDTMRSKPENYRSEVTCLMQAVMYRLLRRQEIYYEYSIRDNPCESVYPAIHYIRENYAKQFAMEELAKINNYSINHFRKLFREQTGCTPLEYLINVRLKIAAVLLRSTDKSILEIAGETGFETLSSFNRHFKRKYRLSPSRWRADVTVQTTEK